MDETTAGGTDETVVRFEPLTASDVAELVLGVAAVGVETAGRVVEAIRPPTLVTAVVRAPLTAALTGLGSRLRRADWSQELLRRGHSRRGELGRRVEATAQRVAAAVVEAVLDVVDLTDIVVDHVDLDAVVSTVDLDRAVSRVDIDAIVSRVDVDAIVERLDIDAIVSRVDVDAIVERLDIDGIVARVDLDRAVSRVDIGAIIERLDIDGIVARVDLDRAVSGVDIDAIVGRVDIDAIAARIDLDAILDRVDVNAVAQRLDLDAVVGRLDLIGLAEYVVEEIDLPGIIQSSSGAMASEGMREVRWQGVGADERVAHVVDRMLRRRPRTPGPGLPAPEIVTGPVIPGAAG